MLTDALIVPLPPSRCTLPYAVLQFGLCYGLWKTYFRKAQYQVLILGLDYAGKTVGRAHAPSAHALWWIRVYSSSIIRVCDVLLIERACNIIAYSTDLPGADEDHLQQGRPHPAAENTAHRGPQQ